MGGERRWVRKKKEKKRRWNIKRDGDRHTCFFRHAKEVVTPESKLARAAATMPGISFTLVSDMIEKMSV